MIATTARFGILFSLLSRSVWAVDLVPASHGNIRGQGPEEESRHLTDWSCTASAMQPAPKACGLGITAGFYPDTTNPRAYCQCTGSEAPGRWEECPTGLIWKELPGNAGICDWPPPVTVPPTSVTPTKSPTEAPAWACTKSNFGRNGVGECGAGIVAGYYPDLDRRNGYCLCTGTTAPSRYQRCQRPLAWDSFQNNSGSYLVGDLDGKPFGENGLWGTSQGLCNWRASISPRTKERPPYKIVDEGC